MREDLEAVRVEVETEAEEREGMVWMAGLEAERVDAVGTVDAVDWEEETVDEVDLEERVERVEMGLRQWSYLAILARFRLPG